MDSLEGFASISEAMEKLSKHLPYKEKPMIKKLRHKFGAIACERDGLRFPSLLERDCYNVLVSLREKKQILFFLRQIPFDLPGPYIHRIDYCVFSPDEVFFIESKGRDLPLGKMKREQVESIYKIVVHVVKKATEIYKLIAA